MLEFRFLFKILPSVFFASISTSTRILLFQSYREIISKTFNETIFLRIEHRTVHKKEIQSTIFNDLQTNGQRK